MDSSKYLQGNEECSSSESGWTTYIASPDNETDQSEYEDVMTVEQVRGYKKDDVEEDVDSDDSMASDASSGPSDQRHLYRDERKYVVGKKHIQQEEKKKQQHQQIKAEKDKPGQSAGRSKKM
ncbi:hypothetical protein CDL12_14636 [Handroanthus impetiginosus]|uniref:Uncharacterized protein n=1 Tax=Handroanthus impetiginosus TaxID=429701 RepID=A0A2G9H5F8_9LAMI|nr:hypothetical protein CDL12_14636 [Handroanthus impetiginosus]